jgi:hypothetical protein
MYYLNTSLLSSTPTEWLWQWSWVKPTILPLPGCTGCTTPKSNPICTSCWSECDRGRNSPTDTVPHFPIRVIVIAASDESDVGQRGSG